MRLLPVTLALALALAPLTTAQEAPAGPEGAPAELLPGTWRLVQHTLVDAGWGGRPSHTVLAPQGWKVEGGAFYPPPQAFQCFASQDVKLTAPDGATIEVCPDGAFVDRIMTTWDGRRRLPHKTIDSGYVVLHYPETPRAFARFFEREALPADRPQARDVRVKEVTEIPELTAQLREALAPARAQFELSASANPGMTTDVDGSVLGIELESTEGGRKWTHVYLFAQTHFTFECPSALAPYGDTGRDRHVSWTITGSLALHAPAGQVEDLARTAIVVRNSLRATPAWLEMQARHRAKIQRINDEVAMDNLRTAANIARISSRANADIMEIQRVGHADREAIRDELFAQQINSIHEVHEYRVPGEDLPVALPSYYDRVFSNGNGEYILTNDALYEPGSDLSLSGDWQALDRVR